MENLIPALIGLASTTLSIVVTLAIRKLDQLRPAWKYKITHIKDDKMIVQIANIGNGTAYDVRIINAEPIHVPTENGTRKFLPTAANTLAPGETLTALLPIAVTHKPWWRGKQPVLDVRIAYRTPPCFRKLHTQLVTNQSGDQQAIKLATPNAASACSGDNK